jgi:hypothetical protein
VQLGEVGQRSAVDQLLPSHRQHQAAFTQIGERALAHCARCTAPSTAEHYACGPVREDLGILGYVFDDSVDARQAGGAEAVQATRLVAAPEHDDVVRVPRCNRLVHVRTPSGGSPRR